jgi:hypothetical protein
MFESSRGNPKHRDSPQSFETFGESIANQTAEYLLDLAFGQARCDPYPRGVGSALSRNSRQHAFLVVRQDETFVLYSHHDPKRGYPGRRMRSIPAREDERSAVEPFDA